MIKKLLKNNILLSTSSFISLIINVISIPIITRIYTPENIGIFVSLQIISMILFPLLSMRMEIIFGQKIKISEIKTLFSTVSIIGLLVGFLLFSILFIASSFLNQETILSYFIFIVLLSFFLVYFEFGIGILNRLRLYQYIAIFSAMNIFFQRGLQIILGLIFEDKVLAIFLSYCLSNFLLIFSMYFIVHKRINIFTNIDFNFNILKKYYNHIFYRVIYTLGNLFKDRLLILIIISFYSTSLAGLYTQSLSLLAIPVLVFSNPLKTIITREFSENKIDTINMIIIIYNLLIFSLVPFYIFFFFHSYQIFQIVLGQNWTELSGIFNIMLFPMLILIFSSSLDRMYDVLNIQKWALFFELFFGITIFLLFLLLSINNYEFLFSMKINAIVLSIFFSLFLCFGLWKSGHIERFKNSFILFITHFIFCGGIFYYLRMSLMESLIVLIVLELVGLVLFRKLIKQFLN
tara:strand:+ start:2073 stop:3458 length:1386 start_codon:yes stop_codon:yes gene_type:complete